MGSLESIEPPVPEETTRVGRGGRLEYLAWQDAPTIDVTCTPDGSLRMQGVRVSAWQAIELARLWDAPDREPDDGTADELLAMFTRVRRALLAWAEASDHLLDPRCPIGPR